MNLILSPNAAIVHGIRARITAVSMRVYFDRDGDVHIASTGYQHMRPDEEIGVFAPSAHPCEIARRVALAAARYAQGGINCTYHATRAAL